MKIVQDMTFTLKFVKAMLKSKNQSKSLKSMIESILKTRTTTQLNFIKPQEDMIKL